VGVDGLLCLARCCRTSLSQAFSCGVSDGTWRGGASVRIGCWFSEDIGVIKGHGRVHNVEVGCLVVKCGWLFAVSL